MDFGEITKKQGGFMGNLLEVRNLSVSFDTPEGEIQAVRNVSFALGEGEILAIVGESGCGKSVLCKSILKLLPDIARIKNGQILLENTDITNFRDADMRRLRGRVFSMVLQDPMTALNPAMTIGAQIEEAVRVHGKAPKNARRDRVRELLTLTGLQETDAGRFPHMLSGGQRQRAVLAAALAGNPKILFADEPTTALDVTIQAQVLELMSNLKEELGTSLLLITHDLGVVAQVCDRVAIMYGGEIVESGTIAEVFDHPHHPYTIGLFGSIPTLDETVDKLKPIQGQMPDPTILPEGCAFAPRCPYASEVCRHTKPETVCAGGGHRVRCLAHQGAFQSPELMEEVRRGR